MVNGELTGYQYDKASRLTQITHKNQITTYTWDAASRLTLKTLPNGIQQVLDYDNANRLLSLTYKKADNTVIDMTATQPSPKKSMALLPGV